MADTKNLELRGGRWHLQAVINGVRIRKSLKTTDLEEARKRRDEKLAMLAGGADDKTMLKSVERQLAGIGAEEKAAKEDPLQGALLMKAFAIWKRDPSRRPCGENQTYIHDSNWRNFLKWLMDKHPDIQFARQLTRDVAMEWAADELEACRAVNTYNHHVNSVKTIFKSLRKMDAMLTDPFEFIHVRSDADDARGKLPFTDAELDLIKKSPETEYVRLAKVGYYTTLRLQNAARIRWEDFDQDLIYYHGVHSKTKADATHRIHPDLRAMLSETPPDQRHGYVFPDFAELPESGMAKRFREFLGRCGIQTQEKIVGQNGQIRTACVRGFHSFRHTAITRALRNGAPPKKVQRLSGHSSDRIQRRYTHLDADDAGDAAEFLDNF